MSNLGTGKGCRKGNESFNTSRMTGYIGKAANILCLQRAKKKGKDSSGALPVNLRDNSKLRYFKKADIEVSSFTKF